MAQYAQKKRAIMLCSEIHVVMLLKESYYAMLRDSCSYAPQRELLCSNEVIMLTCTHRTIRHLK